MPIAEWNVPFTLTAPKQTINFNDFGGPLYLLDAQTCDAFATVRSTKDNVPQADGSILHKRFYSGYECHLVVQYWENPEQPACDAVATDMHDDLMRALRSLTIEDPGRLVWTPTDKANRMLDQLLLLEYPTLRIATASEGLVPVATFVLDTPFPYGMDEAETTTQFRSGTYTQTLTNNGSAPFYPVWKVYGSTCYWTIRNNTTGQEFIYDADLPGADCISGGDYAEIDTFRNTIYLNGDQDNLKPGVDILNSDFFALEVGANQIVISGEGTFPPPDVDCLWQAAWA